MHGRRNPFVAQEGLPFIAIAFAALVLLLRYESWLAVIPAAVIVLLFLIFRDPLRIVPSVALGVVSPVDGEVIEFGRIEVGDTGEEALRVLIKIDHLGSYTARSPVEGKIMDLGKKALWVQTDEGDDVVLKFSGYRLRLPPRSFARIGERLGQGQRCAYLRLARFAEVQWPVAGTILVERGQKLMAGIDVIGCVPNSR